MMISCDQMQDILQGDSGKDDTEIQEPGDTPGEDPGDGPGGTTGDNPGDTPGQDDPTDDPVGEITPIGNVTGNGTYSLKGTVVTVGPDAYILADDTGAILVYGGNHGRTSMEVIKVKGTVSRYKGYDTNVFQVATSAVVLLDEESKYESSPVALDAASFDALVGKKASCTEVSFTGPLTIDTNNSGTFVNVQVAGAKKKASFKYYKSIEDYRAFDGKNVDFRGYVVGTYNYLYVMPVSVTLEGQQPEDPTPDPEPDPEPTPEPTWGVCGSHNGWGGTSDSAMEQTEDGLWVARKVTFPSDSYVAFKLRYDGAWTNGEYGHDGDVINMQSNTYCTVTANGGRDMLVKPGTYDIWLDIANTRVYVMSPGTDISEAIDINNTGSEPEPEPEPGQNFDKISSITSKGTYTVQGTVVAVGSQAYIIADDTDAMMVYGSGHGRSLGDVVKITGEAYRHNDASTNVFQMKGVTPEVVQTGASYDYNPIPLTADGLDSWVGGTANCYEVEFVGKLERSGSYINIAVEGASKQGSFSYVDNSEYNDIETGSYVRVKGFIVGTNSYLKVLPYSVVVTAAPAPDVPTAPKDADPRGKKWMELPAMNDSSLGYYYHSFDMNGKTYRNYSFGWDDSNKVAYWVAYPLCKFYTNSYNGKNNRHEEYFIQDPLLGDASPRPGGGYAGDYDRGHQIPSADRQCSELANGQTYYGTNMTAQSNPLNGGPWAQLEGYIRDFAKSSSDTTYVVTGCYVKDSSEWETDSDGMKIKVPTAYFKAVLVLKNGNWTGGAYWTPHKSYSSSYTSWAISIDWLEEKTGIDFFVNLPDKIGASAAAAIEAATPGNPEWWR